LIEQYATPILIVSIALNALWLLGACLVLRTSKRRWLWRILSLLAAMLAVIWSVRITGSTPAPTHTVRLPLLAINFDLALVVWHAIVIPLALAAMVVRGVVVLFKAHKSPEK
jgi:hypothetical protein